MKDLCTVFRVTGLGEMKKLIVLSIILMQSSLANAFDHLLPEQSIFTGIYYEKTFSMLSLRLGRMHGRDAFANVVVLPSFSRSYVVSFENYDAGYKLICMQTMQPMVAYQRLAELKAGTFRYSNDKETENVIAQLEAELPENYMDVEAEVIEIELDEVLGRKIYDAWGEMLYETRYPFPGALTTDSHAKFDPGNDGTTYHFSFFHDHTPLSGWVWDYSPDGRVAKLVAVVDAAKGVCESKDANVKLALSQSVKELVAAMAER